MSGGAAPAPGRESPAGGGRSAEPSLDELLDALEAALQRLADPAAPLDQAVRDYERAGRLLAAAEARLEIAGGRIAELQLGRR
jgi:exodeoxyribonuclease VII small subunit